MEESTNVVGGCRPINATQDGQRYTRVKQNGNELCVGFGKPIETLDQGPRGRGGAVTRTSPKLIQQRLLQWLAKHRGLIRRLSFHTVPRRAFPRLLWMVCRSSFISASRSTRKAVLTGPNRSTSRRWKPSSWSEVESDSNISRRVSWVYKVAWPAIFLAMSWDSRSGLASLYLSTAVVAAGYKPSISSRSNVPWSDIMVLVWLSTPLGSGAGVGGVARMLSLESSGGKSNGRGKGRGRRQRQCCLKISQNVQS